MRAEVSRERRAARHFADRFPVDLAGALLAAHLLTGGWFHRPIVAANANLFDGDNRRAMLRGFVHFYGVPVLAAAAGARTAPRPVGARW